MLPEGATCAQIFALLEKNGVCTAEKLGESAANTQFDYWFLEDIPYGETNRLEGFLFPDTYDFYVNDDPDRVLESCCRISTASSRTMLPPSSKR